MTGNGSYSIYKGKKLVSQVKDRPIQDIFRLVHEELFEKYQYSKVLWDRSLAMSWGNRPISKKQVAYIKKLIDDPKEIRKINFSKLNQYQAGCLINLKKEESRKKGRKEKNTKSGFR